MNNLAEFKLNLESRILAAKITNEIWEDEKSEARIKVLEEVLEDFNKLYFAFEYFVDLRSESIEQIKEEESGLTSFDIRYLDGRLGIIQDVKKLVK